MTYVSALLPVIIYVYVVYKLDSFSLVSVKGLLMLVLCGVMAALTCFGLFTLTGRFVPEQVSDYLDPVVEEIVKAFPLMILAFRRKMVFFIDSVIFGAAVGGGFAFLENIFYLSFSDGMGIGTVIFRGVETALVHLGCSAIFSVALMLSVRLYSRRKSDLKVSFMDFVMSILLYVASPGLHILHNSFHFNPATQFLTVFGVLALFLIWLYQYDSNMIHGWLDTGLDTQVNLLMSVREGELGNTETGRFLQSVKDNFPPEVYFDAICYVTLFIDLSVAAKSRFMVREAGLDVPIDKDTSEKVLSQFTEFEILGKNLGKTARMTLSPIVRFNPADRKSLNDLLEECRKVE